MNYWNERYAYEAAIWGALPSHTVSKAEKYFNDYGCSKILVPGCGYGRNSNYFEKKGFIVTGVDMSEIAIGMARRLNPRVDYIKGSFLDINFEDDLFDAIYCYNFFQYLLLPARKLFVKRAFDFLRSGGILYLAVFSEEEKGYGKGNQIEPDTFELLPGRPAHYFTRNDLIDYFTMQTVLEEGTFEENEKHGPEGQHVHLLRHIVVKG